MMRILYTVLLIALASTGFGQTFKYYYSNNPKFLKGTDTLAYPFTGGVDAPQFSSVDLNGDGHKDIFVFDRSTNRVLCFLYTASGYVHAPQYEYKFPFMKGWALMRDFNMDGKEDLWTVPLDDRRYSFDTVTSPDGNSIRILVQTDGTFGFKQIGQMATDTGKTHLGYQGNVPPTFNPPPIQISVNNIDVPSLEDMDGDGDIDIIAFYTTDFSPSYYENYKVNPHNLVYGKDSTRFIYRDKCWAGIFYDVNAGYNYFDIHKAQNDLANCSYRLYGKAAQKHSGTTSLMLDVNQDGVKDLIYGDVTYNNLIALINGKNIHPLHRDSIVSQDSIFPKNTVPFTHINFPAAYYVDADGDGLSDLLATTNNTIGVKNTNNVWMYKNTGTEASPVFNYQGNNSFFMFNNTLDYGSRTVPVVIDLNGDGKKDLLVATSGDYDLTQNSKDKLIYYQNVGSNSNPVFQLIDSNFLGLSNDTPVLEMHPTFGDLTGDGKPDMVIGMTNGKLLYYQNGSVGNNYAFMLKTRQLGNIDIGNNSTPQLVDLNKDGLLDLIIGNKDGVIGYFKNRGTNTAPVFNEVADIDTLGGIVTRDFYLSTMGYDYGDPFGYATPQICELDGDTSTLELVTGMWNGKVFVYTNVSDTIGKIFPKKDSLFALTAQTELYSLRFGQRSVPCAADLDNDSRLDLLIGNIGGGLNFYASIPSPVDTSINRGLSEINYAKIKVYPNPAKNELNFDTYAIKEDMQYEVVDLVGKVLLSGDVNRFYATYSINTQTLAEGMYFLKLKGDKQTFISRFLINR
jgi:hypothetical protein